MPKDDTGSISIEDRFYDFVTKDFPNFAKETGERLAGVETQMQGVQGRLKKLETNGCSKSGMAIVSNQPAREDDSTVVEIPSRVACAIAPKAGLSIPWGIVLRLLGLIALVLMATGFYIGNSDDKEEWIKALNSINQTTQSLKAQIRLLNVPAGDPTKFVDDCTDPEEMMRAVP